MYRFALLFRLNAPSQLIYKINVASTAFFIFFLSNAADKIFDTPIEAYFICYRNILFFHTISRHWLAIVIK